MVETEGAIPDPGPAPRAPAARKLAGISAIIPVYNGERSIGELVRGLIPVLEGLSEEHEVLLVNDGSSDGSWGAILDLAREFKGVRGINLKRNFGQHNALLCGVRAARHGISVTMDDDLQHPPGEIPRLLEKLEEGHDVVYGWPRTPPHSAWRDSLSRLVKKGLSRATGIPSIHQQCPFRAFRTDLRDAFEGFSGTEVLLDVLFTWSTTRFATVEVEYDRRRFGVSNYDFRKLLNMTVLLLTWYSTAPLRLASWVGFLFTLFGVSVLAYVLTAFFVRGSLPGFTFLASILTIFSGAQLFAMGIFGEYLARLFKHSLDRPAYVVKDTVP